MMKELSPRKESSIMNSTVTNADSMEQWRKKNVPYRGREPTSIGHNYEKEKEQEVVLVQSTSTGNSDNTMHSVLTQVTALQTCLP